MTSTERMQRLGLPISESSTWNYIQARVRNRLRGYDWMDEDELDDLRDREDLAVDLKYELADKLGIIYEGRALSDFMCDTGPKLLYNLEVFMEILGVNKLKKTLEYLAEFIREVLSQAPGEAGWKLVQMNDEYRFMPVIDDETVHRIEASFATLTSKSEYRTALDLWKSALITWIDAKTSVDFKSSVDKTQSALESIVKVALKDPNRGLGNFVDPKNRKQFEKQYDLKPQDWIILQALNDYFDKHAKHGSAIETKEEALKLIELSATYIRYLVK